MNGFPGLKGRLHARLGDPGLGVYSFLGCLLTIVLVGLTALAADEPMLLPSLGPTVMLFFESSLRPAACPRNALIGHGIGIACGWGSLAAFGLLHSPSALSDGFTGERVAAAAASVALTAIAKHFVSAPHPPAAATALIISLGLLTTPAQLAALFAGVVLATAAAWCINRLLGVPMPIWGSRSKPG